eukprot:gene12025-25193_t
MGRINNSIKWAVMNINFVSFMFAIAIIAIASYLMASQWGDLDSAFFTGWGVVLVLFGVAVSLVSFLGCFAVLFQIQRKGRWTGRRIISVYLLILLLALLAELYVVVTLSATINSLRESKASLCTGCKPLYYDLFEKAISNRFNDFYFASVTTCGDKKFAWFYLWVNKNCPIEITQSRCQSCHPYSITSCAADRDTCSSENLFACPYDLCRKQILSFLINQIGPLSYFTIAFTGFQLILMTLGCCICCYNEAETDDEKFIKTGIARRRLSRLSETSDANTNTMAAAAKSVAMLNA